VFDRVGQRLLDKLVSAPVGLERRRNRELRSLELVGCRGPKALDPDRMQSGNNSVAYFANTTFNYPTMAEAYRVAALNGLNRLL
jgi:NAD(P) transhydrogenase